MAIYDLVEVDNQDSRSSCQHRRQTKIEEMKVFLPWDYGFFSSAFRNPFSFTARWGDHNSYRKLYESSTSDWDDFALPFSVRKPDGTTKNVCSSTSKNKTKVSTSVKHQYTRTVYTSSTNKTESDSENQHSDNVKILNTNVNNNGIVKRSRECPFVSPSLPNVAQNATSVPNNLYPSPTEFDLAQSKRVTRSTDSGLSKVFNNEHSNERKHAHFLSNRRLGSERPVAMQQNTSHRHDIAPSGMPSYISEGNQDDNYFYSECSAKDKNLILPEEIQSSPVICPTPSYPAYDYLKIVLHNEERQVDFIKGDGNCFFRALSKVLYTTEGCHYELRQAVVDFIEKYPREFQQFIDGSSLHEYIIEMRRSGTWATQAEIYAAATLLQRDIYVLSPDPSREDYNYKWLLFSPQIAHSEHASADPCYITLCHTNANHYDRIAALDGGCNCPLAPPVLSGVSGYVDLTA